MSAALVDETTATGINTVGKMFLRAHRGRRTMQHARKKDLMHTTIVRTLQGVGAAVKETYQFPGCLDLICAFRGQLFWVEIKNNTKTAAKDLTDSERAIIADFARAGVKIHVWCSPDEALRAIGAL